MVPIFISSENPSLKVFFTDKTSETGFSKLVIGIGKRFSPISTLVFGDTRDHQEYDANNSLSIPVLKNPWQKFYPTF